MLEAQIRRIEQVNPRINALSGHLFDNARREALASDRRYEQNKARPLEGLTVAAKEEQPIEGQPLTLGSNALPPEVSDRTHPILERIREAGGIIHIRTTTPEFCAAGYTESELWGITRNPWNTAYSCGGSSGGSGAALAAGFTTLATGSDIAGSIRIPAAFNGVVGYKPAYSTVPAMPPMNLDTYCHDGAMARTVADSCLLNSVISGQHVHDFVSLPHFDNRSAAEPQIRGMRIGIASPLGSYPVSVEIQTAVSKTADGLRNAGAEVTAVQFDWDANELTRTAFAHFGSIMAPMVREVMGGHFNDAEAYTKAFVETSEQALKDVGHYATVTLENRIQTELLETFENIDVLLCPATSIVAFKADARPSDSELEVDGSIHQMVHHLQAAHTLPFNMASRSPVFTVPVEVSESGVPIAVQIVGAPYTESNARSVAQAVQSTAPWYKPSLRPSL